MGFGVPASQNLFFRRTCRMITYDVRRESGQYVYKASDSVKTLLTVLRSLFSEYKYDIIY